jgi:hypothetical protein
MAQTTQPGLAADRGLASRRIVTADEIEGTPVHARKGGKLGTVDHVMIDKRTGDVCYVLVALDRPGGGLCPVPWQKLAFDSRKGVFVSELDGSLLKRVPRPAGKGKDWDAALGTRVDEYFGLPTRWTPDE